MEEKVMLCCIGKNENRYIREYVEYYKNLGVANINLYDNNDPEGEHFEDVIGDYIESGFVILVDYRGRKNCQFSAYEECYDKYKDEYDWFCFFDCDEFLTFTAKGMTVGKFLSQPCFDDYDMVHVNWMCYGDNGCLHYEDKPVLERFPKPVKPFNFICKFPFPENCHIKSMIRGYIDDIEIRWKLNSHTPYMEDLACCDVLGNYIRNPHRPFWDYDYSKAYLRHYLTKSTEEYCEKINRGFPDYTNMTDGERRDMAERYFRFNKKTDEKLTLIKEMTGISVSKNTIDNIIYPLERKNWR